MSDVKLGVLPGAEVGRDAVHVAIIPLMSDDFLSPGDHVGWTDDYWADQTEPAAQRITKYAREKFGIVDPFFMGKVEPGTRVWVCLYPTSITSLRHVWSHPMVPDEPMTLTPKMEAEMRLKELASSVRVDYEEFLEGLPTSDMYFGEECYHLYEHADQIKADYYTVTGRVLDELPQFRCSC
jgi:hypothetical protein